MPCNIMGKLQVSAGWNREVFVNVKISVEKLALPSFEERTACLYETHSIFRDGLSLSRYALRLAAIWQRRADCTSPPNTRSLLLETTSCRL